MDFTYRYQENIQQLDRLLGVDRNYDVVVRDLHIGNRRARLWMLDGYAEDGIIERMLSFLLTVPDSAALSDMQSFIDHCISFVEANAEKSIDAALTGFFAGKTVLLVEGYERCALIDAKNYPSRGVEEPYDGRVLRGAHDGFVEILLKNTGLIRRRIRDCALTMENHKVGKRSRTDVVLCYLDGKVDPELLSQVRRKLKAIDVNSLSMGQESVAECLMKPQWYNPFPKVRYTERPDTAAACIMEGKLLLLVDNSPAVMILPTSFFDFVQEANDFYFPPLVGSYLRLVRASVFLLGLFITPVWYLLVRSPGRFGDQMSFLMIAEHNDVPILVQLLLTEFIVDMLKLASLNTPDVLSNSFSMIGALVMGDFAVKANLLVPEVLVYMAFVAIANFTQPSYELGYAFKLLRIMLLLLIGLLDWIGLALGTVLILLLLATTKPISGNQYLSPLVPFQPKKLFFLLLRRPISPKNT